jgi:putative acetyltransferase
LAEIFIDDVIKDDYNALIELWELSVRATHDFLTERDILFYKDLILNKYFDLVRLKCARDKSGNITGFIGTSEDKIEMLFVHPQYRGQGIGKQLLMYAVNHLRIFLVDVNEQNEQAVGFYKAAGFHIHTRSLLDGMGKPFPVLHLRKSKPDPGVR